MVGSAIRVMINSHAIQENVGATNLRTIDKVVATVTCETALNQALLPTKIEGVSTSTSDLANWFQILACRERARARERERERERERGRERE